MAAIKQIDGAGWPGTGSATANTTGLAAVSGLTHVPTADVPPGSSASGVLRSVENATASFRVDALASVAPSTGNHYWLRFWLRGVRGVGAAPASHAGDYGLFAWDSGSNFLTFKFATDSDGEIGWTPLRGDAGIAGGTTDSIMYDAGPEPVIGWGDWCEVVLHVQRHATTGQWRLFINGTLYSFKTGIDTDSFWGSLAAGSFVVTLPQWVGAYWEVSAPIESRDGTDMAVTPQWDLISDDALATKILMPFCTAQSGGLTQGCHFQVSGSGTVTVDTEYLNQSGSPCRHRYKLAGSGNAPVVTTIPTMGRLPYNEHGWGHLVLSDLLVPTSGYAVWQVSASGGSALFKFFVTGGSVYVATGSNQYINVGAWTHATARYSILLHLNRDGRAAFTIIDLTGNPAMGAGYATTTTSRDLPDWTPQDIGVLVLTAGPTANDVECGFMGVYARPTLYGVDSIATAPHTPGSGNTSIIQNAGCVMRSFPTQHESQCLPGAHYRLRHLGLERRIPVAPLGRSGLLRRDFTRNVIAPLTHCYGCELISVDGGSINDIAVITTGDDDGLLAMLESNFDAMLAWAVDHEVTVWAATMLPRDLRTLTITDVTAANPAVIESVGHGLTGSFRLAVSGVVGTGAMSNVNTFIANAARATDDTITMTGVDTSGGGYTSGGVAKGYTSQELAAITKFNTFVRTAMAYRQRKRLLYLSDIEADAIANPGTYPNTVAFWPDFTHPSTGLGDAGGNVVAQQMVALRQLQRNPNHWHPDGIGSTWWRRPALVT